MNRKRQGGKLLTALALGLAALAACAGAAPASAPVSQVEPLTGAPDDAATEAAKNVDRDKRDRGADAGPPSDAGPGATPRCPYGELVDPHRGFVRCLTPDERGADWLPPAPQPPPPPVADAPDTTWRKRGRNDVAA